MTLARSLPRLLPILALLLVWQWIAASGAVSAFLLPRFTLVAARVWDDLASGALAANVVLTVYRAFAGFAIAAVLGITVGVAMARSRAVNWFFDPIISIGFPMPTIAFLPIFILWFGLGDASKIVTVAVADFFIIASSAHAGARGVDKQLIWSARSLGASERATLADVVVPAALPHIITGLQIGLPIAMIVALVTEMIMGGGGLGGQLLEASRLADSPGVFASIVEIAAVGAILLNLVRWARGRLLRWHQESHASNAV